MLQSLQVNEKYPIVYKVLNLAAVHPGKTEPAVLFLQCMQSWIKTASLNFNVHDYDTRKKNKIVIDRVKLESTKRAFFYKGADIFNDCI